MSEACRACRPTAAVTALTCTRQGRQVLDGRNEALLHGQALIQALWVCGGCVGVSCLGGGPWRGRAPTRALVWRGGCRVHRQPLVRPWMQTGATSEAALVATQKHAVAEPRGLGHKGQLASLPLDAVRGRRACIARQSCHHECCSSAASSSNHHSISAASFAALLIALCLRRAISDAFDKVENNAL